MDLHLLHQLSQSAYTKVHSTETALLRVHSDIVRALDRTTCVLLILLDLSAAFYTIDHDILLYRLQSLIGCVVRHMTGSVPIFEVANISVLINGIPSTFGELLFGVSQGSVLGQLLFIIYTSPLGKLLKSLGIHYYLYTDDIELYLTFDIKDGSEAVGKMEHALSWMANIFYA